MGTPESPTRKQRRAAARDQRREQEQAAAAAAARRKRLWQLGAGAVVAAVLVGVAIAISSSGSGSKSLKAEQGKPPGTAATAALLDGIPQARVTLGSPRAPVTLEEFADLQCPFCREYTVNVLPTLVRRYVRTGKVKMVFRNLTFIGPDSQSAAKVASAAGLQNRLWQFIDLFYANQQVENTGYVTDAFMRQIAGGVTGLNVPQVFRDRNSQAVASELAQADSLASQAGITSTPSFQISRGNAAPVRLNYSDLTSGSFTPTIDKVLAGR